VGEASHEKWSLTQQAFDRLLAALGADRDAAADRYLEIRRNLVRLFEWRGCPAPDECADETLNRCARKLAEGEDLRDVATYCLGIARFLVLEMSRQRVHQARPLGEVREPHAPAVSLEEDEHQRVECLQRCLRQLPAEQRELILGYYRGEKTEKIRNRKGLTDRFGVAASTLRMRALRVREVLQSCTGNCVQRRAGAGM
jgi:DNA-directed RNA polymerase specialized sigma24 family protein